MRKLFFITCFILMNLANNFSIYCQTNKYYNILNAFCFSSILEEKSKYLNNKYLDTILYFDKSITVDFNDSNYTNLLKNGYKNNYYFAYYHNFQEFLAQSPDIINYLLQFENDSSECDWVRSVDPLFWHRSKFLSKIRQKNVSAMILIYNYLNNNHYPYIVIPGYEAKFNFTNSLAYKDVTSLFLPDYSKFKKWYFKNQALKKDELKKHFKEFNTVLNVINYY